MTLSTHTFKRGFTIAEIMIVVAVVGILSTIVVVMYAGSQQRSKRATFDSTSQQLKLKLGEFHSQNNVYPATKAIAYQYLIDNNSSNLATPFNTSAYSYVPTCTIPPSNCQSYTITVDKSNWSGSSSDSNIVTKP